MPIMKKPTDPDILSAREVAALLGLEEHTVYESAARGELPARRVGRRVLFSRHAIDEWMHGKKPATVAKSA